LAKISKNLCFNIPLVRGLPVGKTISISNGYFWRMKWIYRFTVFFARIVIFLGGLLIPKIRHFSAGRKNLFQRIHAFRKNSPGELTWF
ncbi:hypothetical protein, partial [Campylobacter fetus]